MSCTNTGTLGVPYGTVRVVSHVRFTLCPVCHKEFADIIDDDFKTITTNYADHFRPPVDIVTAFVQETLSLVAEAFDHEPARYARCHSFRDLHDVCDANEFLLDAANEAGVTDADLVTFTIDHNEAACAAVDAWLITHNPTTESTPMNSSTDTTDPLDMLDALVAEHGPEQAAALLHAPVRALDVIAALDAAEEAFRASQKALFDAKQQMALAQQLQIGAQNRMQTAWARYSVAFTRFHGYAPDVESSTR